MPKVTTIKFIIVKIKVEVELESEDTHNSGMVVAADKQLTMQSSAAKHKQANEKRPFCWGMTQEHNIPETVLLCKCYVFK